MSRTTGARRRSARERGAAAVELAIVLPLLLLVIGGIIDFGRLFFTQIILTNAAREGARAAVVVTSTVQCGGNPVNTCIQSRAAAAASALPVTVTVNSNCTAGSTTASIQVAPSTPFTFLLITPASRFFGATISAPTVSQTAVMGCS